MEVFRRLTFLLMFLSFIGCSASWIYYNNQLNIINEVFPGYQRLKVDYKALCGKYSNQDEVCLEKREFMNQLGMYKLIDEYSKNKKTYIKASFLIPAILLIFYLAFGWVINGKVPNIRKA